MKLVDLVSSIDPQPTDKYGSVIFFGDIVNKCKLYGQDNHHLIDAKLKELEEQGFLTLVYQQDFGFEDLIIGVIINNRF